MTYKNIMVAVSNEEEDIILIKKAFEIAKNYAARLTMVHIDSGLSQLYPGVHSQFSEEMFDNIKDVSDKKLIILAKEMGDVDIRIEQGMMPETLLEIVQEEGCDLLICGHHHSFINRLMPAYRGLINKAAADLLIVPLPEA